MVTPRSQLLDKQFGALIQAYRKARGLSQLNLGKAAGISFQQIQKYEAGTNRVSISRLFAIASSLNVEPTHLIEQLQHQVQSHQDLSTKAGSTKFKAAIAGQKVVEIIASINHPGILERIVDLLSEIRASLPPDISNGEDDAPPRAREAHLAPAFTETDSLV